jgi:2-dehydro-3-deoxyphosphogluconate aldolase/(4S)-4-hydroxy-2-oxoglutarate aldolase
MTPLEQSRIARDIAHLAPIIPVLVVEDVAHARPLAEALVRGHLPALEVTLRTPAALDAIAAMAEVSGGVVGAGTLLTPGTSARPRRLVQSSASRPAPPTR